MAVEIWLSLSTPDSSPRTENGNDVTPHNCDATVRCGTAAEDILSHSCLKRSSFGETDL